MAIIVEHRRSGNQYLLLGINSEGNGVNPSRFLNELFDRAKSTTESSCSATVCDVAGNIFLAYIEDLIVIEIDGVKPADILPEPKFDPEPDDYQPQQDYDAEFEDDFESEPEVATKAEDDSPRPNLDEEEDWI